MGCVHSRASSAAASSRNSHDARSSASMSITHRPNAPLRLPRSFHSGPNTPRTRSALVRERQIFFETRVTGRAETWAAIRTAVELVREQQDLATAQGVLDAAGVTVPRGRLEEGLWDETGELYRLENWVVGDPRDVIEDEIEPEEEDIDGKESLAVPIDAKAVSTGDVVKVKVRLSDRGTDVLVSVGKQQNMKVFRELIRDQAKIAPSAMIKLVYLGKILQEHQTLARSGWEEGHVISALVASET